MFSSLRNLFRPRAALPLPAVPPGHRVYAVGDIHGRADLFTRLIESIEADECQRGAVEHTTVILLGDLIDRGPDSRGVLQMAAQWGQQRRVRVLLGNHEEMMLQAFDQVEVLRHYLRHGGRETALSFGVDERAYTDASFEEVQAMLRAHVPGSVLDFIRSFENSIRIGDYLFVHAGIRPGTPLEAQAVEDLRWIREPFLSSPAAHGAVIVHGHTITETVEERSNRLGIDTGAYDSGRLTALGLEGEARWVIQTECGEDGVISTSTHMLD